MPTGAVGRNKKISEKVWQQAKAQAKKSYKEPGPDTSEGEKSKFYGTTMEIAKNIQGKHGRRGWTPAQEKKHAMDTVLNNMVYKGMSPEEAKKLQKKMKGKWLGPGPDKASQERMKRHTDEQNRLYRQRQTDEVRSLVKSRTKKKNAIDHNKKAALTEKMFPKKASIIERMQLPEIEEIPEEPVKEAEALPVTERMFPPVLSVTDKIKLAELELRDNPILNVAAQFSQQQPSQMLPQLTEALTQMALMKTQEEMQKTNLINDPVEAENASLRRQLENADLKMRLQEAQAKLAPAQPLMTPEQPPIDPQMMAQMMQAQGMPQGETGSEVPEPMMGPAVDAGMVAPGMDQGEAGMDPAAMQALGQPMDTGIMHPEQFANIVGGGE